MANISWTERSILPHEYNSCRPLTVFSTCKVISWQRNNTFCFQLVTTTSTFYYSHVLLTKLAQCICSNNLMEMYPIHFFYCKLSKDSLHNGMETRLLLYFAKPLEEKVAVVRWISKFCNTVISDFISNHGCTFRVKLKKKVRHWFPWRVCFMTVFVILLFLL